MDTVNLWLLTILIVVLTILGICFFPFEFLSSVGSIFAASGSFIAIIWFYHSLQIQSRQLQEQRNQFQLEFKNLRLESNRSTLLIVREILKDMNIQVGENLKGIGSIEELPKLFLDSIKYLNPIFESDNPRIVQENIQEILKILIPARRFLYALKEAGLLILENENIDFFENKKEPEWFIIIYNEKLSDKPFISSYVSIAMLLATYMTKIKLDIIDVAFLAVSGLKSNRFVNDEAKNEIIEYKKKNEGVVPKIVEIYLDKLNIRKE